MSTFQILHLSDLHVSAQGNFDRSVVLDPLISQVEMDINAGFKPEIVVVTGTLPMPESKRSMDWQKSSSMICLNR